MPEEKRRYTRYDNTQLALSVARPGFAGIIRSNPTAACLNFSLTGLQFDCPDVLKTGEKLLLDLAVGELELQDMQAVVVSQKPTPAGNWCYGVRFCLENKPMQQSKIHHHLLQIENRLKSHQDFPD